MDNVDAAPSGRLRALLFRHAAAQRGVRLAVLWERLAHQHVHGERLPQGRQVPRHHRQPEQHVLPGEAAAVGWWWVAVVVAVG